MTKKKFDDIIRAVRPPKIKYACDNCYKKFTFDEMKLIIHERGGWDMMCEKCYKETIK